MSKIKLRKIRRIHVNNWEYQYGTQIILVHREHPSNYYAFVRPNLESHNCIFRRSAGDLHHFIREFRRHLYQIEKDQTKES